MTRAKNRQTKEELSTKLNKTEIAFQNPVFQEQKKTKIHNQNWTIESLFLPLCP